MRTDRWRTCIVAPLLVLVGCAASPPTAAPGDGVAAGQASGALTEEAGDAVDADWMRAHYEKSEHLVPMRDGARLHTTVYRPRDASRPRPILMIRTPYSSAPYGAEGYAPRVSPDDAFLRAGWIMVSQDVRGRYLSEGEHVDMRPHRATKSAPTDVDESTDTRDTIDWLLANVPGHNGRVGQWGISYPGFHAAAGMIDAHPALRAVSPQAPIADWWFDDFRHHGAFFLPHCFGFMSSFGLPRPEPTTSPRRRDWDYGTPDGYDFYLRLGGLRHANERYLKGEVAFWNDLEAHPDYDAYWQARNLLPHLRRIGPAVLVVGGWFDAEDLYGALNIHRAVEDGEPTGWSGVVMGPWVHGGWNRTAGDRLGDVSFGGPTSPWFHEHVLVPFFMHHLDDGPDPGLADATMFDTGAHEWRRYDAWPPRERTSRTLHLHADGALADRTPADDEPASSAFTSDPAKPVPFTQAIATGMTREYMAEDQRFAARRPDVLVFSTPPLAEDLVLAGPIVADLWVSTSREDADWIVKVIDVFPDDATGEPRNDGDRGGRRGQRAGAPMGGFQMMVRSEVLRGRYRDSYEHPAPFVPDEPTRVRIPLQDVLHTFRAGHRLMVQVQSTWFPLVDRNPQRWVDDIFRADDADFAPAEHRVWHDPQHPSAIVVWEGE